jgi:hypothetical protein
MRDANFLSVYSLMFVSFTVFSTIFKLIDCSHNHGHKTRVT